ncbi:MAG TPA: hypothetical protein VHD62_12260 [Opitutaceae bacterium]|nr:hypothetical protein [Opitutaceae bacterium]
MNEAPASEKAFTYVGAFLTLVGAIGGLLEGTGKLFQYLPEFLKQWGAAGWGARWTIIGVAIVAGVWLLLRKRVARTSRLLQPKRFILRPDDPACLKGREEEVEDLVSSCEKSGLVFLEGESGTGKSSLVRAGVIPACESRQLLPVWIDLAGADWEKQLMIAVGRELWRKLNEEHRNLTEEQRRTLGLGLAAPRGDDVWLMLRRVEMSTGLKPLLIFDQFDDYQLTHRDRFRVSSGRVWIDDKQLRDANGFWRAVAQLVENSEVHMLVVTRADLGSGLDAVRFIKPKITRLTRVSQNLIAPLLDELSQPMREGGKTTPVIAEPESGWQQLKARLISDLAQDSMVLPIQLSVCLQALHRLAGLTVSEYERCGGSLGLERLHIERNIAEAAQAAGLTAAGLRTALMTLVDVTRGKTRSASLANMAAAYPSAESDETIQPRLVKALELLESRHLVRRVSGTEDGEEAWMLHHDFLSRGLAEADRWSNRWTRQLADHSRQFDTAGGFAGRWRALLTPFEQLQLWGARLTGKFRLGEYRSIAWVSLARFVPWAAVIAIVVFTYQLTSTRTLHERARTLANGIGRAPSLDTAEIKLLYQLADSPPRLRLATLETMLEDPEWAQLAARRPDFLLHATLQLDPAGKLRRQLDEEILRPQLSASGADGGQTGLALEWAMEAGLPLEFRQALAKKFLDRVQAELKQNSHSLGCEIVPEVVRRCHGRLGKDLESSLVNQLGRLMVAWGDFSFRRTPWLSDDTPWWVKEDVFSDLDPVIAETILTTILQQHSGDRFSFPAELLKAISRRLPASAVATAVKQISGASSPDPSRRWANAAALAILAGPKYDEATDVLLFSSIVNFVTEDSGRSRFDLPEDDLLAAMRALSDRIPPATIFEIIGPKFQEWKPTWAFVSGSPEWINSITEKFTSEQAAKLIAGEMALADKKMEPFRGEERLPELLVARLNSADFDTLLERAKKMLGILTESHMARALIPAFMTRDPAKVLEKLQTAVDFSVRRYGFSDSPSIRIDPKWAGYLPKERIRALAEKEIFAPSKNREEIVSAYAPFIPSLTTEQQQRLADLFRAELSERATDNLFFVYELPALLPSYVPYLSAPERREIGRKLLQRLAQESDQSGLESRGFSALVALKEDWESDWPQRIASFLTQGASFPSLTEDGEGAVELVAALLPKLDSATAKALVLKLTDSALEASSTFTSAAQKLLVLACDKLTQDDLRDVLMTTAGQCFERPWAFGPGQGQGKLEVYFYQPAKRLDPDHRKALAVSLVHKAGEMSDPPVEICTVLLEKLAVDMNGADREFIAEPLLSFLRKCAQNGEISLSVGIASVLQQASRAELVALLKEPTTVGELRKAVLQALEAKSEHRLDRDLWLFVDWIRSDKPPGWAELNLIDPPVWWKP